MTINIKEVLVITLLPVTVACAFTVFAVNLPYLAGLACS